MVNGCSKRLCVNEELRACSGGRPGRGKGSGKVSKEACHWAERSRGHGRMALREEQVLHWGREAGRPGRWAPIGRY